MVEKEISSHNYYREAFWEIAFWWGTSSHQVPPFPSWKSLLKMLSKILQRDIWELIEGYGEKGNIHRSKQEWTLLRNCIAIVNATHRITRFSSVISLLTQSSGNLQLNISCRNEAYGEKGNILRWKLERSFLRNFLVMCEFSSQSYTYVSWSSPLTLSLRKLRRPSLDHIED